MEGWSFYTSDELKARGWLRRQLALQAAGLCGNLDKIWPDVQRSAWIGGDREGWERVPYWLDGFIPLAYLLEDADMIAAPAGISTPSCAPSGRTAGSAPARTKTARGTTHGPCC